jgi:hypothetical protein
LTTSAGLNVRSTATASGVASTNYSASLATGNYQLNAFGTAQSTNNCGFTAFNNTGGAGATSNYAGFGIFGYTLGLGTLNACANGNFGICTTTPAATLDIFGTAKVSGALTCGALVCTTIGSSGSRTGNAWVINVDCGTLTTNRNTISCGAINIQYGISPIGSVSDLGSTSLGFRDAYHSGTHYNSSKAGFTANSTAALTTLAPFHMSGTCDANNNSMIIGNPGSGTGVILDDAVNAKWKIQTFGYALAFLQQTSGTTASYGTANFMNRCYIDNAGQVHAQNTAIAAISSDARLKTNIRPIDGALDWICGLAGRTFDYICPRRTRATQTCPASWRRRLLRPFPRGPARAWSSRTRRRRFAQTGFSLMPSTGRSTPTWSRQSRHYGQRTSG